MASSSKDAVSISHMPRIVAFHPTRDTETILNVDGSSFGNSSRSGFSGLPCTNEGRWLCGFSGNIGISNNLHAELLGLFRGLMLAWEKDYRATKYCTESALTLHLVSVDLNQWHFYASVIKNFKNSLLWNWRVDLEHTLRNACVDFLAKLGAHGSSCWTLYDTPPAGMDNLLLVDPCWCLLFKE